MNTEYCKAPLLRTPSFWRRQQGDTVNGVQAAPAAKGYTSVGFVPPSFETTGQKSCGLRFRPYRQQIFLLTSAIIKKPTQVTPLLPAPLLRTPSFWRRQPGDTVVTRESTFGRSCITFLLLKTHLKIVHGTAKKWS